MRKKIGYILCLFITSISCIFSFTEAKRPNDRLYQAYRQSHTIEQEPYSSDIEAEDMFQESNQITLGGPNAGVGLNDNVLVRFARFMMRMALVIGVSMLIYVGIRIAMSAGDSGKLQEALTQGGSVLVGAFLVLASVAIVFLISSVMRGSLDYELFNS